MVSCFCGGLAVGVYVFRVRVLGPGGELGEASPHSAAPVDLWGGGHWGATALSPTLPPGCVWGVVCSGGSASTGRPGSTMDASSRGVGRGPVVTTSFWKAALTTSETRASRQGLGGLDLRMPHVPHFGPSVTSKPFCVAQVGRAPSKTAFRPPHPTRPPEPSQSAPEEERAVARKDCYRISARGVRQGPGPKSDQPESLQTTGAS